MTLTPYQQSDMRDDIEVAADMFLNWVYSSQAGRGGGFANSHWQGTSCQSAAGCPDSTNPGIALYQRMNNEWMPLIFTNNMWH